MISSAGLSRSALRFSGIEAFGTVEKVLIRVVWS
jgi:hypothetical protein